MKPGDRVTISSTRHPATSGRIEAHYPGSIYAEWDVRLDGVGPGDPYLFGFNNHELCLEAAPSEPPVLPHDSESRKAIPLASGVLDYFPAALVEVAKVSKAGNDKHNPGEPLHWARGKSTDQADAIARHLLERGGIDPETGQRFSAQLAWRALALLQLELEEAGLAPLARGATEA